MLGKRHGNRNEGKLIRTGVPGRQTSVTFRTWSTWSPGAATAAAGAPRCQVEGCHAELAGAKDYHRRHKVCATHSKAPRVVVLGAEQRFCQQCSRSVRPLFYPACLYIRARALW